MNAKTQLRTTKKRKEEAEKENNLRLSLAIASACLSLCACVRRICVGVKFILVCLFLGVGLLCARVSLLAEKKNYQFNWM